MVYEIDGIRRTLTAEQVSELFQSGRLNRDAGCRPFGSNRWRTVDELFPLLKYGAVARMNGHQEDERPPAAGLSNRALTVICAISAVAVVLGSYYLYNSGTIKPAVVYDHRQPTQTAILPGAAPSATTQYLTAPSSARPQQSVLDPTLARGTRSTRWCPPFLEGTLPLRQT